MQLRKTTLKDLRDKVNQSQSKQTVVQMHQVVVVPQSGPQPVCMTPSGGAVNMNQAQSLQQQNPPAKWRGSKNNHRGKVQRRARSETDNCSFSDSMGTGPEIVL